MLKPMIDEKMLTGPRRVEPGSRHVLSISHIILFERGVCHFVNAVIVKCIKAVSEPSLIVKPIHSEAVPWEDSRKGSYVEGLPRPGLEC